MHADTGHADTGYQDTVGRPRGRDLWQVPRSRGATSGLMIALLGVWGALIPFVGPYFDFGFTTEAWSWTAERFWLQVLPGVAAFIGGLILLFSGNRATASLGATIASVAGAWFVVGPPLSLLWNADALGTPLGGDFRQALVWISFFYGLGALILFLGAGALGRLSVVGVRDVVTARARRMGRLEARRATGRHGRRRAERPEERAAYPEEEVYPSEPAGERADEQARERTGADTRASADRRAGQDERHHWWERSGR